jgi:hypothetical protein
VSAAWCGAVRAGSPLPGAAAALALPFPRERSRLGGHVCPDSQAQMHSTAPAAIRKRKSPTREGWMRALSWPRSCADGTTACSPTYSPPVLARNSSSAIALPEALLRPYLPSYCPCVAFFFFFFSFFFCVEPPDRLSVYPQHCSWVPPGRTACCLAKLCRCHLASSFVAPVVGREGGAIRVQGGAGQTFETGAPHPRSRRAHRIPVHVAPFIACHHVSLGTLSYFYQSSTPPLLNSSRT